MRNRRAEVSKVTWKLTAFGSIQPGWRGGRGVCLVGHNQIDACIGCASDRRFGGRGGGELSGGMEGGARRGQSPILARPLPVYLRCRASQSTPKVFDRIEKDSKRLTWVGSLLSILPRSCLRNLSYARSSHRTVSPGTFLYARASHGVILILPGAEIPKAFGIAPSYKRVDR